ncbi:MAG: phospholipase, patatin family [Harvfovirus sp.]|uniref:Phospholipase, patatin family n=1 Tax=Harvfovirus sp. TaxID=2487768 RepID=A0A3G5A0F9_9VIRU|nr:MAG: phospholipase, patatin family [Harvfovirus sp.]
MNENIVLSISGGAGLFPASIGACYQINEYIKEIYPNRRIKYAGVSSGCIVAIMLSLEISQQESFNFYQKFVGFFDKIYKNPLTYWYSACRKLLEAILSDPLAYKKLNNNLHVGITKIKLTGPEFVIISQFESNQQVIDAIIVSGTLFPLSWTPLRIYNGYFACDGGYLSNYVTLKDHYNIVFKYDHVTGVFNPSDWLISISVDKWHRLFQGAQRHIRAREPQWKQIITSQQNTKDIITSSDTSNTLTYALRILKWLILKGRGIKIFMFLVTLYFISHRMKKLKYIEKNFYTS